MKSRFVTKASALLLVLALVCAFAGCAGKTTAPSDTGSTTPEATNPVETTPEVTQPAETTPPPETTPAPKVDIPAIPDAMQQPENTPWLAVSADASAFDLTGGYDNPNFRYVFENTKSVPLDQLIAFALVADGLSEGACDELRSRFLEAPNTVLAYLILMGDQRVSYWDQPLASHVVCQHIASADAAWYGGSQEFADTMAACRKAYPQGPVAELLDVLEKEHAESMDRNQ